MFLDRLFRRATRPLALVLYSKPDRPLCDELEHELARVRARGGVRYELRKIDIRADERWLELYGRSIPVLEIEGRVAFKGRASAADIERKLARAARARGAS